MNVNHKNHKPQNYKSQPLYKIKISPYMCPQITLCLKYFILPKNICLSKMSLGILRCSWLNTLGQTEETWQGLRLGSGPIM